MGYVLTFIGGMAAMLVIIAVCNNKVYTQDEMDEVKEGYEKNIQELKGYPPAPPPTREYDSFGRWVR
jgi:hypothetical protein